MTNFSSSGGISLPVPKLRLRNGTRTLSVYDRASTDASGDTFLLYRYPEIVAMDLTQEMIDKDVYVEMVVYKNLLCASVGRNKDGGYVIPTSMKGGASNSPFPNFWTRGGEHRSMDKLPILARKPNHYIVSSINEIINVWEYIDNRHCKVKVNYKDINGVASALTALCVAQRISKRPANPGRKYSYSGRYMPFYCGFRYVTLDTEANDGKGQMISGPLTKILKIVHKQHPFLDDASASIIQSRKVCSINPLFKDNEMECFIIDKNQ